MATEQQNHLKQVAEQSNTLVSEINSLEAQSKSKREMLMKLQGIAEYLDGLGVKLPTEEEAAADEAAASPEVVTPEVETPAS